jgi:hypothetical protein
MHPLKGQVPPSRKIMLVLATCLALGTATLAYGSDRADASAVRHMKGRTIFSDGFPRAKLSIRGDVRFIAAQHVNLHGNAEAEQYVFASSDHNNIVNRFYLIQFEHFLPSNSLTYDYSAMKTDEIGKLQFSYDVKAFSGIVNLLREDQGSDGQALEHLLESKQLYLPRNIVLVRMFHLPSTDHRTELMIIYGEALPQNTDVPVRDSGFPLDTELPTSARKFLDRAREGLVVRTR